MWNDIRENIKNIKSKLKSLDKKADIDEYSRLAAEYSALKADLNAKKSAYYAELAKLGRREERKKKDHIKFILGGIAVKYLGEVEAARFEKIVSEFAKTEKLLKDLKNEK